MEFTFASADRLRRRIAAGERADIFASANREEMACARTQHLIAGEPQAFATNRLTIIVPRANPQGLAGLADLGRPGLQIVAEHADAPLSRYTLAMVHAASQPGGLPTAVAAQFMANCRRVAATAREMVAQVVDAQADAAVVYVSDITPPVYDRVQRIAIPDTWNVQATYMIGVVVGGGNASHAAQFIDMVGAADGQAILARWGFGAAVA